MKKIKLNSVLETLSEMELKELKGGSSTPVGGMASMMILIENDGGGAVCPSGQHWDWFYMCCVQDTEVGVKVEACKGLQENEPCVYELNGKIKRGRCITTALSPRHCSDLI
jgi:hypothetical protein